MTQYALPIANDGNGAGAPVEVAGDADADWWDEMDEGIDSGTPDDTTTWWRGASASGEASNYAQTQLGSVTDPGVSTGHAFKARVCKTDGTSPVTSGGQHDITIVLYDVTTARASVTLTDAGLFSTLAHSLSGAEADSISNYGDLAIRIYAVKNGGGAARAWGCSTKEFQCPDAVTGSRPFMRRVSRFYLQH